MVTFTQKTNSIHLGISHNGYQKAELLRELAKTLCIIRLMKIRILQLCHTNRR